MKYVLFSDIHGNYAAFEAMMEKFAKEKVEGYFFCGDFTGYYYESKKIINKVKKIPHFYAVCGNHDAYYLKCMNDATVQKNVIKKFGSSYCRLEDDVGKYLKELPTVLHKKIGNFTISMIHGSPASPLLGRIYPDTSINEIVIDSDFLFTGHTHYQMLRSCGSCCIVNPGSLGQPRDGGGFSYCEIDMLTGDLKQGHVQFDISALIEETIERDPELPYLHTVLKRWEG